IEAELKPNSIYPFPHAITVCRHDTTDQQINTHSENCFRHEIDAIRLKATTLLRSHQIPLTFSSLMHAKIESTADNHSQTTSLSLIVNALPGTTIRIKGSFKRNPKSPSTPLPESFQLTFNSIHTGFPYPSQHHGWALDDALIPIYPH